MGDIDDINTLFRLVDSDGSGYIDKEKLQHICPHLSSFEIDTIFDDFDHDHDNRISLKDLIQTNDKSGLSDKQQAIDHGKIFDIEENMSHTQINEILSNLGCQEQIFDFYETLRNGSNDSTNQFQSILEVFVCDILKYRKEIKRLEDSYKRDKETNEKYLRHIEEDQERDMNQLEEKIRQEERQKFDVERELIQQRTSKEINDLESNLQRLQKIEQLYTDRKSDEDSSVVLLREEIAKLTEEKQILNASLNDSLTTNAILQSDLQSFRTQLTERQTMLLQEKQSSSSNYKERESLQTNVRHLVEVNKQLRDENDSLRAIIETNKIKNIPAESLLSPRRLVSTTGSSLGSYWNQSKLDSPTTPNKTMGYQRKLDSFDLESADEIGIRGSPLRASQKLDAEISSNALLPSATVSMLDTVVDENNSLNDSGLSLTTIRDATEIESGHQSKSDKSTAVKSSEQYRTLINTRNNDDTDSDDAFIEISLERNNLKRGPLQRSKRTTGNARQSSKQATNSSLLITQSPLTKRLNGPTLPDQSTSDLSFDRMYKVVFCGDAAVGKSTLIMRLSKGIFVANATSTLGVDFYNKQIDVDSKRVAIQLWDTAGQERFRSIAKSYFRRCDGVILVYDATYERSFLNVREWINIITDATPKKVSVMIVANKIDLRDQIRAEGRRVIEQVEGAKLAKEYKALFIETSAKDGTNSNETLIELARDMQCNEDLERFRPAGLDLGKSSKKSTCCGSSF